MSEKDDSALAAVGAWSPDRMIDRLGGDEALARELAAIFVAESPRMLAAVREAVTSGSADAVRRAAHALKGSMSNFIDGGPVAEALALETMGRESRLEEAPAVLERLEASVAALVVRLSAFQAGVERPDA